MTIIEIMARAIRQTDGHHVRAWGEVAFAKAALRALEEAGYVVVPKEPNNLMMDAGYEHYDDLRGAYKAMLSARPDVEGGDA